MFGANAPASTWHMTFDNANLSGSQDFAQVSPSSSLWSQGNGQVVKQPPKKGGKGGGKGGGNGGGGRRRRRRRRRRAAAEAAAATAAGGGGRRRRRERRRQPARHVTNRACPELPRDTPQLLQQCAP